MLLQHHQNLVSARTTQSAVHYGGYILRLSLVFAPRSLSLDRISAVLAATQVDEFLLGGMARLRKTSF